MKRFWNWLLRRREPGVELCPNCRETNEYKGFRSEPTPGYPGTINVLFIRKDGTTACCGQASNLRSAVEGIIRRPLPTWMTGEKEPRLSPFHDAEKVRTTCVHHVDLNDICYSCVESYGSARRR